MTWRGPWRRQPGKGDEGSTVDFVGTANGRGILRRYRIGPLKPPKRVLPAAERTDSTDPPPRPPPPPGWGIPRPVPRFASLCAPSSARSATSPAHRHATLPVPLRANDPAGSPAASLGRSENGPAGGFPHGTGTEPPVGDCTPSVLGGDVKPRDLCRAGSAVEGPLSSGTGCVADCPGMGEKESPKGGR